MERKIENPLTGKMIKMKGQLYQTLKEQGVKFDKDTIMDKKKKRSPKPKVSKKKSPRRKSLQKIKVVNKEETHGVRGWKELSPVRLERRELLEKCGEDCILAPSHGRYGAYPVCQKYEGECKLDCRGLLAAKIRSGEWKHKEVQKKADMLAKKYGCAWRD